jgi:hypothetical protein
MIEVKMGEQYITHARDPLVQRFAIEILNIIDPDLLLTPFTTHADVNQDPSTSTVKNEKITGQLNTVEIIAGNAPLPENFRDRTKHGPSVQSETITGVQI